jgi:hypothetical protein
MAMMFLVIGPQCWGRGRTKGEAARNMRLHAGGDWHARRTIPVIVYESADPGIAVDEDGVVGWDPSLGPTTKLGQFAAHIGRRVTFTRATGGQS